MLPDVPSETVLSFGHVAQSLATKPDRRTLLR
jgi:hypothetical protein